MRVCKELLEYLRRRLKYLSACLYRPYSRLVTGHGGGSMAGKQSGSQKSHFGSPAGSFFCSCLGPPRCSSDRLPPHLHNAPWKMAGRSSVFGPMPRETLLTNMSNDPGATDNDFARPVSEEKGRERERGGSGRRAEGANELRRKTDANIICRATRERARERSGSTYSAAGFISRCPWEDRRPPWTSRGKSWRRCLNRSLTTARCDHRARERR